MKKLILLLTVFFTCLGVKAQEATTDYIYSSDGFVVKEGVISVGERDGSPDIYKSCGLYSKDGKVLVAALYARVQWGGNSSTSSTKTFYIIDGCETIASGAFQCFTSLTVYIPSSVRSIAPDAIISRSTYSGQTLTNGYGGIQDGVIEVGGSGAVNAPAADPNATEVARYNIQGVRLSEPTDGVNIVQMSDGTAQKVLVK
ncbi:MAG: hypothetical protein ACI30M_02715 [Muribaculaceae bacterium]